MKKQLPLLAAGVSVSLFSLISSLGAADATAPAASSGSAAMAPASSAAPAAASGSSAAVGTAANPDLSKLPAPSTRKDITFDKDIAPMLKASCATCHGGATPRAKFDVTSMDSFVKGGSNGAKDVVAGHSDKSLVVLYAGDTITKTPMPPLRNRTAATNPTPALTKDQLAVLRAWIDQGAKDPAPAMGAAAKDTSTK